MTNKKKDYDYIRVEVLFNPRDPLELSIYKFVIDNLNGLSKSKYIRNILLKEMKIAQVQKTQT